MDDGAYAIQHPVVTHSQSQYDGLDAYVVDVIRTVDLDMRRKPAHMVYEMIDAHLSRRPPGVVVDREVVRAAAARISVGMPV
jgi:hypothetical protein